MSEIRINIIDEKQTISGEHHGSFGDVLVAALTAEPETIAELEKALERFIPKESDRSVFRSFKKYEDLEPWDAGLLVIDLAAKVIMAESSYSYYSKEGTVRIKTDDGEDFGLPYKLSDDWNCVGSLPEFNYAQAKGFHRLREQPPFDARAILFGKPLFEYIVESYLKHKNSDDEELFTNIHAEWLMTARDDLRGKTPREVFFEKQDFIDWDMQYRSTQWSFTKVQPPPISKESNAYKFSGFGRHEYIVHYDLFRHLLGECFENNITDVEVLSQKADKWLSEPQGDLSGRVPADIIGSERQRINLTASAHECVVDDDCEVCEMMALDFIDSPMFFFFDGSHMEYDRFEFSFCKTREEWETEQRRSKEFDEAFALRNSDPDDVFDDNEILI